MTVSRGGVKAQIYGYLTSLKMKYLPCLSPTRSHREIGRWRDGGCTDGWGLNERMAGRNLQEWREWGRVAGSDEGGLGLMVRAREERRAPKSGQMVGGGNIAWGQVAVDDGRRRWARGELAAVEEISGARGAGGDGSKLKYTGAARMKLG